MDDGAALIDALRELDSGDAAPAALDAFIRANPELLRARVKPYGSALAWVLEYAHEEAALALLRAGARADEPLLGDGRMLALSAGRGLDRVVTALLASGTPVDEATYWGTALHAAAGQGHASTLRILLAAGAPVDARAEVHRYTPLMKAAMDRHEEVVRVLLAAGAALEARDDDGCTALHWAVFAYVQQAKHLYGPDGGPHDTVFVDPGPANVITLLLDAGADLHALDDEGDTPLHDAARFAAPRPIEALLARGARRDLKNHEGRTPRDLALARGERALAEKLR